MSSGSEILQVIPLTPNLGAKVALDISGKVPEPVRDQLRTLFARYHLLFIEAPGLSKERHLDLFETFGKAVPTPNGVTELYVSNVLKDGYLGSYELEWHIDGSYLMEPYTANCLYALDLQAGKSATRFASAASAIDRFPDELKKTVRFLQVINASEIATERGKRLATHGPDLLCSAHRLISRHPVNGVPYITANRYQTDCVLGLDGDASRALLDEIYRYLYDEKYVYEHWWKNGDLVIWDNLIVHHARRDMSTVGNRTLRRYTSGPALPGEQIPAQQKARIEKNFSARVGPEGRPHAEPRQESEASLTAAK